MTLEEMYALVRDRAASRPADSGTVALLDGGVDAIGKKLLEEAAESWMAGKFETRAELAAELSQVLYYATCLMVAGNVSLEEVLAEL